MAFTQQQLDAVDAAIASGTLSVEYAGRRVVYRSMGDLMAARNMMATSIEKASGNAPSRVSVASFSRG